MRNKPTYTELENKLREAEEILDTLRSHQVDAVVGTDQIALMRLKHVEDQLQEQIRISSNRLKEIESIYESVPVGLCILDTDLTFVRVNDHLARMNGIPADDHMGQPVTELLPDLDGDIEDEMREVLETGSSKMNVEVSGETPARPGEERHWLEHWLPLSNKDQEVIGLNVVIQEITERKRHEQKLRELNATLEERVEKRTESLLSYQEQLRTLASRLSKAEEQERQRLAGELHDNLGQMLAVSKMKVDLLQRSDLPEEISGQVDELKELVEDSLVYTRDLMSDLKPPPSLDKQDVRASINWLAQKMEKHDLQVKVEDDGQPKHTSEEIRTTLLQSVRELLFNVLKHTEEDTAYIYMDRTDDQVQIVVEDKGKGFEPESNRAASTEEGGFGLFNIHERLDMLGCQMEIDSEPGEGTRITIAAPLKEHLDLEEAVSTERQNTTYPSQNGSQTINVLLAEDHQMIRKGLKKIVDSEDDLKVIAEAADGQEAVDLAQEMSPDIIVMDVNMPRLNGIEATQKIRSIIPGARIVALSLHDHQEVIDSMRSAGASAYISKNEAFETLAATIRSEATVRSSDSGSDNDSGS